MHLAMQGGSDASGRPGTDSASCETLRKSLLLSRCSGDPVAGQTSMLPGSVRQIAPAGRVLLAGHPGSCTCQGSQAGVQVHEDAKAEADHAVPTVHILLESLCERDCNG